jgi:2-polyprenyl-6-methoxyphenol hydroxylase-like FAD-dependent oxidoreductase
MSQIIVSGRSETGKLLAWMFASHGYRVISVEKHAVRQTGAVYTLRQSTFDALESISSGLGGEIRNECRNLGLHARPILENAPRSGFDVGQSPPEWVISAERLYATLEKSLDARPTSGSVESVEGKLQVIVETGKTTWTVDGKPLNALELKAPSIVCCAEGFNGTTLETLGVEKEIITPTQYWIIGVVEEQRLGKRAQLSVRKGTYKSSRLSDGRGRTAIHIQVPAHGLSQDDINDLFRKEVARLSNVAIKKVRRWDIRGSNGVRGTEPNLIAVCGKAARQASLVHDGTIIAGFGDNTSASTFQTGGGINKSIAEASVVACALIAGLKDAKRLEQIAEEANKKLLNFADWFSYTGATMFYQERHARLVQTIYYHLLQQWHKGGCPPCVTEIWKKIDFVGRQNLDLSRLELTFPGYGGFDIRPKMSA